MSKYLIAFIDRHIPKKTAVHSGDNNIPPSDSCSGTRVTTCSHPNRYSLPHAVGPLSLHWMDILLVPLRVRCKRDSDGVAVSASASNKGTQSTQVEAKRRVIHLRLSIQPPDLTCICDLQWSTLRKFSRSSYPSLLLFVYVWIERHTGGRNGPRNLKTHSNKGTLR